RRGVLEALAAPADDRLGAVGLVDLVSGGADGPAFGFGDLASVGVAEFVEGAVAPARGESCDQHRGEGAGGGVVVFAFGDRRVVVAAGQGGVDVAGQVGGLEHGFAQSRVIGPGGWSVVAGRAGLADAGDQSGEGAVGREAGEPVGVA